MKNKTFIIAELSANHNGDLKVALETVRAAKRSGADAIKLQTYTAETLTIDCKNDYFKINHGTAWDGEYLYDLYKRAFTPWEWHKEIFKVAKEEGLVCFSSPFDTTAVDFLEELETPIYKIASFEIQDIPLIEYAASKGKPMIISTGIAEIDDIELAIETCKNLDNNDITILKCTSAYPADPADANLLTIPDLKKRFGVKVGLSDHTMGIEGPVVATCLGSSVIEKHFILNKEVGGADAHFSLDEKEFTEMVKAVRKAELMMGNVNYAMTEKKKKSRQFSRSLFIVKDVKAGDKITLENVRSIRPGYGMHPKFLNNLLGKVFQRDFPKGTPMSDKCY
ncbi:pseudaminic acid synthase [Polaribacter porphyrae]|uniref:Pseudaminic acid synthase n=1 Tax=Polaribacter porphyrae TaxID=1137780 RepID=A0A2S7WJI8_9FLAO|nr:pseudaminic acid synthase [Polaribacter porphyrae]PQJ77760.1 pseudaminic acid synthase [Polaribacter porphyrae]